MLTHDSSPKGRAKKEGFRHSNGTLSQSVPFCCVFPVFRGKSPIKGIVIFTYQRLSNPGTSAIMSASGAMPDCHRLFHSASAPLAAAGSRPPIPLGGLFYFVLVKHSGLEAQKAEALA